MKITIADIRSTRALAKSQKLLRAVNPVHSGRDLSIGKLYRRQRAAMRGHD
jgi:hypothetical protein